MKYVMKSGILYDESKTPLLIIKGDMLGPSKKIYLNNGELAFTSDTKTADPFGDSHGEVDGKEYRLATKDGCVIARGFPEYADEIKMGWPFHRISRIDHARIRINQCEYSLYMHNSQNYTLFSICEQEIVRVMHNGIEGGWSIYDTKGFPPEIITGLYVFCRYIERENEFIVL